MTTIRQQEQQPLESLPIASFFSALQLQRLTRADRATVSHDSQSHQGAFLFLDVVAFTQLGENLSEQGVKGAEILSDVLHAYYEPILSTIDAHGGDVLFFAGDALGVVWLAEEGDLGLAAVRAAQCGLAIQARVPAITSKWSEPLTFRASLGVGSLEALSLGGVDDAWMQLVRGEAVDEAYRADRRSAGGALVLSERSAAHLRRHGAKFEGLSDGHLQLMQIDVPVRPLPAKSPHLQEDAVHLLEAALPEGARRHLSYASNAITAEFRRTTVLFLDLTGADAATLQEAVETAQREVGYFEGVVYQVLEDDKGTALIIVFGLPGTTHADDPLRALLLAQRLTESFGTLALTPRLGIATGTAFCGTLGTAERQQYSIMGSSVNLAARLKSMAEPGQTVCDSQTRKLAADAFEFEEAGWTTPKGFREPVAIFRPVTRLGRAGAAEEETELVGRTTELEAVEALIAGAQAGAPSKLLIVRGDAGLGKTAFLHEIRSLVARKGLTPVTGTTDAFETGTAYFAFRQIVQHWCGVTPQVSVEDATKALERRLADDPDLLPLIPLLGPVLGIDIPETELTASLRGQLRSENTQRVLLHLALQSLEASPQVLLIEDGHWMDGASWAFLDHLLAHVPSVLVVLTTRPMPEAAEEVSRVISGPRAEVMDLAPITRSDTAKMVQQLLSVSEISADALSLINDRAEGNALFVREIVRNLLETGDIRIRDRRVQLLNRSDAAGPLPDTLDGVITSRIDRLEAEAQITMKAAAVLGRTFDAELLSAIHPLDFGQPAITDQLVVLEQSGFLQQEGTSGDYVFDHALTRDAAYNLLSFAQRETLHHQTALALEEKHAGNTEKVNARLGYHFQMANIPEKAAPHLAAAGETALDAYASRDAIELLTTALDLDVEHRGAEVEADLHRTHWCRMIGQAHYNQDNQREAARWYQRAMEEAAVVPRYPIASIFPTLTRALFTPARLDMPPHPELTEQDRARITHGLVAGRELGIIHLWESAAGKFALNAVNQVRLARIVGPTDESAGAIATLAFMMSAGGMRRKSEKLALQALRMAHDFGDEAQIVSVQVITGMVMIQNGSPTASLPHFEAAKKAAGALISGIWRHRSTYMLADAQTWLGDYETAQRDFLSAAELSQSAEPHAVGQATAMSALNLIRLGRPEEAVMLLEGPNGVPNALEGGVPASAIMSLGILAEGRLALGQTEAAIAAATEAEAHVTEKDDGTGFYSGLFGYSSILNVRLQTGALGPALEEDFKRMRKLTRMAPLGQATLSLWQGQYDAISGRTSKARRQLERAVRAARTAEQPFELGRALVELSKLTSGSTGKAYLEEAIRVFERHHMPLELARAQATSAD